MIETITAQVRETIVELCEKAKLHKGQIVVIGCSTSEVLGHRMGTWSNPEVGKAIFDAIYEVLSERELYLAAQCCEHLNRAIVVSAEAVPFAEPVNVVPQPKAGGSFGTAAYQGLSNAIVVEEIRADAGLDIGGTLIGMHLKKVAVPVKLEHRQIGEAIVLAARTRPKFIGGSRAVYDEERM
ncbi:MAG: TIGR01440 family protein [Lachnospiraceae bacterium]|nr:TIGR01440 family protein [Lachnospiraceae bacterium]